MPKIIACHPAEIADRYARLFARFLKVEAANGAVLLWLSTRKYRVLRVRDDARSAIE